MKRIEAFIQPHRLNKVVTALHALPHFPGFTVTKSHGQGHGRGTGGHFSYTRDEGLLFHDRLVLLVICEEQDADGVVAAITSSAHTGNKGDGIVVVSDVSAVVHIRSGQKGNTTRTQSSSGDDA